MEKFVFPISSIQSILKEQVYTHVLDNGCSVVEDDSNVRTSLLSMGPGSSIDRHVDFGAVEEGVVHVNALLYVHDAWEDAMARVLDDGLLYSEGPRMPSAAAELSPPPRKPLWEAETLQVPFISKVSSLRRMHVPAVLAF